MALAFGSPLNLTVALEATGDVLRACLLLFTFSRSPRAPTPVPFHSTGIPSSHLLMPDKASLSILVYRVTIFPQFRPQDRTSNLYLLPNLVISYTSRSQCSRSETV